MSKTLSTLKTRNVVSGSRQPNRFSEVTIQKLRTWLILGHYIKVIYDVKNYYQASLPKLHWSNIAFQRLLSLQEES